MPRLYISVAVWFVSISCLLHGVRPQNRTGATTDPDEARALNKIFQTWKITATDAWNISGELCSGAAVDDSVSIDNLAFNPLIKCDCSFVDSTICRIIALRARGMDVAGPIPQELWSLVYISNLNLNQNFLTGSLSPGIGNLTRMQWMTFGANALSGPVPKEIGLLTDLRSLAIDMNNFSGSLPPEIGNCTRLVKMYIGSSGLTGELPSSFANLVDLEEAWINDIQLTGQIPEFIGNWTKLTTLRILGTSLSGPIPSTFANLNSLTELRLGEISNSSSSLHFIRNMKLLSVLVLRNNNLTGTIPSNIGDYLQLRQLDLSFNNLTGQIPASLFNSSQLTHLFLGNNKLSGSLPIQKSSSLSNLDVSYNELTGNLPSWVRLPDLQLNLIANYFTVGGSNRRVFPGLDCLQKSFRCNRGKGVYFNFSVNCGGPDIRSSSGVLYEKDEGALGPASFFVSRTQRWAVSNVGLFTGSNSNQYTDISDKPFVNTSDSEIFQSARLSASSLRYYGLGLENGGYSVTVHFGEIQIQGSAWRSLGRRIFDIYVQGTLVEKDFDIHRTANGSTPRVIQRVYKANVSENYIEIHLFWAGKGTCCIPAQGTYGPLVSAISATPDFIPTVDNKLPSKSKKKIGIIVGAIVGAGMISILAIAVILIIRRKRKRAADEEVLHSLDVRPYTFSYSELRAATQDFDLSNKLGEGGFGPVFKGKLNDGREIAVKQLSVASRQGKGQFVAEIATISAVQHRNLVKLYGCCIEGNQRMLVYEYLSNNSLDQALFEEKSLQLGWSDRFEICLGVAKGLAYMHEESSPRIVHRDVKASNILLDSDLVPKLSDFGLAKLYDDKKTHISTRVAGTIGYLSPEYVMLGHLTEKTDVFAFGIVALEIVSGRPNSSPEMDDDKQYLLEWAWSLHQENRDLEVVDPDLAAAYDEEEVKRVIGVAFLCTQTDHAIRPAMSRVVGMLTGHVEVTEANAKPGYVSERTFENAMSFMSGSTSSSWILPDTPKNPSKSQVKEDGGRGGLE